MPDRTTRPGTGATTQHSTFTYSWDIFESGDGGTNSEHD